MAPAIHVKGGTGAGVRRVKSQIKSDYVCPTDTGGCGKTVKYYWTRCPNCGHMRPERGQ